MRLYALSIHITLLFLLIHGMSFGQAVSITLSETNIEATNGELVSFSLELQNNTNSDFLIKPQFIFDEKSFRIVNKFSEGISLKPNEKRFVGIKAIVSPSAEAKKNLPIVIKLFDNDGNEIIEDRAIVNLKEKKLVKIQSSVQNIIFEKIGDTITVPVTIINQGNVRQKVSLITRFFNRSDSRNFTRETYNVKPFSDTLVLIKKIVDQEMLKEDNFNITIRGLYEDGNIFGNLTITANSVKSRRRYTRDADALNLNAFQQNNQIRTSVMKSRDNYQYFFFANNEIKLAENSTVQTNIDMNYVQTNDFYMLRNTWLRYDTQNFGIRGGNVTNFDILNLIGRGADAYYESNEKRYEVGVIDKSFNLIDDMGASFGKAAWANFYNKGGWLKNGYEASVLYDEDYTSNVRTYFATTRSMLVDSDVIKLRAGASLSNSAIIDDTSLNETGGSGEVNMQIKKGNFAFSSSNFYSTGNYAGLRRGALNLIQRATFRTEKYNFWVMLNMLQFRPKPIASSELIRATQFSTQRYDAGVSRRFNNFSITLSPIYTVEWRKNQNFMTGVEDRFDMQSTDLSLGLNYSAMTSKHTMSLNVITGRYDSNVDLFSNFHAKTTFNYGYGKFRISAFYQHNHFTVSEIIVSSQIAPNQAYSFMSVVPTYQNRYFKDKMQLQVGMSYSNSTFNTSFLQLNGRVDYQLPANLSVFLSTFYSDFTASYYETATIQFGLIKRFSKISVGDKRYNLRIYVYKNVQTPTGYVKEPASGEMVFIGNEAFRTDEKGIIEYAKLPQGKYRINIFNRREWFAPNTSVELNKNTELEILMNKTGTISGKVAYEFTEYSYTIAKELYGLPIVITDSQGNSFSARTDSQGNFRLYVPEGSYTIQLEKPKRMTVVDVPDNNQFIEVKSGVLKQVNFTLKVRERRVERRRF